MGKRGPAPEPSKIKNMKGNPGKRAVNKREPSAKGAPRCPAHLGSYAKQVWKRIVESMPPELYARADTELMSAYCAAAEMHRKAQLELRKSGEIAIGESGQPYQHPWVGILNSQAKLMATLGTRLGLDPTARTSLSMPDPEKPKSKFDGLVGIPGGKAG